MTAPGPDGRVPVEGWREVLANHWLLKEPGVPVMRVYRCAGEWRWYGGGDTSPKDDARAPDLTAAMLAAEDFAASLLRAGLAALGIDPAARIQALEEWAKELEAADGHTGKFIAAELRRRLATGGTP